MKEIPENVPEWKKEIIKKKNEKILVSLCISLIHAIFMLSSLYTYNLSYSKPYEKPSLPWDCLN